MTDQLLQLLDDKSRQRFMMMKTGTDTFTIEIECKILEEAVFKSFMQLEVPEMVRTLEVDYGRIEQISCVLGIDEEKITSKIDHAINMFHKKGENI